jgi:hypothetical protein
LGLSDTTTQWIDSLYFSLDTTLDSSDLNLINVSFGHFEGQPMLASGQSNAFYLGSRLPDNYPTQDGYLILKTNAEADQIETD